MTTPAFIHAPGSDEYASATSPHNAAAVQRPAFVAVVRSSEDVVAALEFARASGVRVLPQATGHGAGGEIGDDVLLIDTRGLDRVTIDPEASIADIGAGVVWAAVQQATEPHGLLGLAGSAPSVGAASYSFGGGIGWLVRPHGLAASALLSVDFVDGAGRLRTASDDATDPADRDAMWAFRGGGGVGVAVGLRTALVPTPALFAGYLLWHLDALDVVAAAWAEALGRSGPALATSLVVVQAPPGPPFPPELQGGGVVHLALASAIGEADAASLLAAVRAAATPVVDTTGPSDVARLGGIHLDPPPGAAARGRGHWLTKEAGAGAADLLRAADGSSAIVMAELRNVDNPSVGRSGALTEVRGPFIGHAIVALRPGVDLAAADAALDGFRGRMEPFSNGPLASWTDGTAAVPGAEAPEDLRRLITIADAVDPDGLIIRSRDIRGA